MMDWWECVCVGVCDGGGVFDDGLVGVCVCVMVGVWWVSK